MDKQLTKKLEFYVKVPGTSANLGPGFDIFGLALNVYNEFYFEFESEKNYSLSLLDGKPLPFEVNENLIQTSYLHYFKKFLPQVEPLPFNVKMKLELPIKGGLGSSASALVAGFGVAQYLHENFYTEYPIPNLETILYELALLEGHPDNTTPAYLGGFVFSYFEKERLIFFQHKLPETIQMFLFIPELETETNDSRKKLPQYYHSNDVIFNLSRVLTWMEFLNSGKFEDLLLAVEDKIHTPYRIRQLPFLEYVGEQIHKLGGCFTLSGSGPSLLIFFPNREGNFITQLKEKIAQNPSIHYEIFPTQISYEGMKVKTL